MRDTADPRELVVTIAGNLAAEIRKRPFVAILVGAGIGFAIGGALSMRLGRAALAAAARYALTRVAAPHADEGRES